MGYLDRDVEVVSINQTQYLVAACDSCGAIGMKEFDEYQIPWTITGRLTTRVALLEVLSSGALPKMITVAISNEPNPTGAEIIKGVKEELFSAGMSELPIVISTEKNMHTQQTGLGISVIGVVEKNRLLIGTAQPGDEIYCLGLPKVGPELSNPEDQEIVQVGAMRILLGISTIHDIVPVGSRGIRAEANQLALTMNGRLQIDPACALNLDKSAGPSTCLIFSSRSPSTEILNQLYSSLPNLPVAKIGTIDKI